MKMKTLLASALVIAGFSIPASGADLLSVLFPRDDVEVITNSDLFAPGLPPASRENPVPYLAVSTGFRDFGASFAGEKEPAHKDVLAAVTKTLASRGYVLATNKTAPKMIIVYGWGTMNADRRANNPLMPSYVFNRYQILRFLGGDKMGISTDATTAFPAFGGTTSLGLALQNPGARDFYEMGGDNYYVIVLSAYDIDEANQQNAKALWSTKISCPSRGRAMTEVLPTMLSIAAPHIGKQMAKPLVVRADDHYKPNVEIGDAEVIEDDVKNPR